MHGNHNLFTYSSFTNPISPYCTHFLDCVGHLRFLDTAARDRGRPRPCLQAGNPPNGHPCPPLHHVQLLQQARGLRKILLTALEQEHDLVGVVGILRGQKWERERVARDDEEK